MSLIRPNEQLVTELFAVYVKQQQTWMPHASRAPLPCIRRFTVPFHASYLQIICSANARTFIFAHVCDEFGQSSPPFGFFTCYFTFVWEGIYLYCYHYGKSVFLLLRKSYEYFTFWISIYCHCVVEISWISWCKSSRYKLLKETICSWLSNVSTKIFQNWKFKVWVQMSSFIGRVFFGFL